MTISKTYYLVESGYNTFTLTENGLSQVVTVPEGNYSMRSFKVVLPGLLNAASAAMGHSWTYTMAYPGESDTSAELGKFVFTVTGNGSSQPSFVFPQSSTIFRQMGFDLGSTVTFSGSTITSTNVIDFDVTSAIYLLSDLIEPGHYQQQGNSVLQEVFQGNIFSFSRIVYVNPYPQLNNKPIHTHMNSYNFSIVDQDGFPINLNGSQILISLLVF
jgi:hypothetical protein